MVRYRNELLLKLAAAFSQTGCGQEQGLRLPVQWLLSERTINLRQRGLRVLELFADFKYRAH
jgi:hypothetical protein